MPLSSSSACPSAARNKAIALQEEQTNENSLCAYSPEFALPSSVVLNISSFRSFLSGVLICFLPLVHTDVQSG